MLTFDVCDASRLVFDFERERLSCERLFRFSLPDFLRLLRDVRLCDLLDLDDDDDDELDLRSVEANFFDLCSSCNFDFVLLEPESYMLIIGSNENIILDMYVIINSLLRFRRFLEYERLLDLDEYERLLLLERESDLKMINILGNYFSTKILENLPSTTSPLVIVRII